MSAIVIGKWSFQSKKAARLYCRELLHRHPLGARISVGTEREFLEALLDRHLESKAKKGPGVAGFRVSSAAYGTRCFSVERIDGTHTDFSFQACLDRKRKSPRQEVSQACREAVTEQVRRFRDQAFANSPGREIKCPLSGLMVSREDAHVDHCPPQTFERLVDSWLDADRLTPPGYFMLTEPCDGQYVPRLFYEDMEASWRAFHEKHAVLRVVHKTANLKQGRSLEARR